MDENNVFAGLEPEGLWRHFAAINRIPRPSGHEQQIAAYIRAWADQHGFTARQDATGNMCVSVPGTAGRESAPPVVLQSHLDMVCERNADSPYDPEQGSIHVVRDGEWIRSEGTTLGADNGIGVAAMLHAAEAPATAHGPLDLLFTVDEETGLTGASQLDPAIVRGRVLLNLDSEEDGVICTGCAGSRDSTFGWTAPADFTPRDLRPFRLSVSGLQGGHSGVDIHKNRLNAIRALVRLLDEAADVAALRIAAIAGGNKRNAIPRECAATILCADKNVGALRAAVTKEEAELRQQYRGHDDGLVVKLEAQDASPPSASWGTSESRRLLALLRTIPTGVIAMSQDIPGLVETSNNLSVVTPSEQGVVVGCMSRSASWQAMNDVVATLRGIARLGGASFEGGKGYPGWKPDLSSRALAVTQATYKHLFGADPVVTAVHAGLECGLIGERVPGMDMVSFGPEIRGPHAPGERVQIPSVKKFWQLLAGVLDAMSK